MRKVYDPKEFETRIYQTWEENGYFNSDINKDKKPFTIVMPPPNITGRLHLGHALNNTIQDILIRYKRMKGYEACWIPGTDHASISTEAKVVEKITSEGKSKKEIGRDEFLKECWDWTEEYGGTIKRQLRTLGISPDWRRDSFTMDENLTYAVRFVFKKMYEEGLIYRGDRIVNWDPKAETALSDAEVYHKEVEGHLWYVKYFFEDSDEYVTIATTRPETMFGDLAVAVNPEDTRFKDKIGKNLILPIVGRKIPLIEDDYVDMEYGTGLVKITPSHDPNDFEVGKRHNLGQKLIMDNRARIVEGYGKYSGLDRFEARKLIVEELSQLGHLEKIEKIVHAVGFSERTDCAIESIISKQWFVKMKELAKPCIEEYEKGNLKLIPESQGKTYLNWLNNIKDWCISRQLWWGHRLPVFFTDDGEIIVSTEDLDENGMIEGKKAVQSEDTLDTWFSSALWPFATLGWPNKTPDFDYYFPTNVLVTGYDIIFFWVIRMVFSSLHETGKLPFSHVLFTGLIRDSQGRKMSKSLGNGVDPMDVIEEYGADALRFTLIFGNTPGNDMRYDEKRIRANRNFANKLWNASRYVLLNLKEEEKFDFTFDNLSYEDKWILKRLNDCIRDVSENLDKYEIGLAANRIERFIWDEYCDWYIEFSKHTLYSEDEKRKHEVKEVLIYVLINMLKLLHPFMPFITEEIYSYIPVEKDMLIADKFPEYDEKFDFKEEEYIIESTIEVITAVRNQRANLNVSNNVRQDLIFVGDKEGILTSLDKISYVFKELAKAKNIMFKNEDEKVEDAVSLAFNEFKVYMPLDDLIDYKKEKERLLKEIERLNSEIMRASKKLDNENFISKAPEQVVMQEKAKLKEYKSILEKTEMSLKEVENHI